MNRRAAIKEAEVALARLPPSKQGYYDPQFQEIGSYPVGTFIGLACKCCDCWIDFCKCEHRPTQKTLKAVMSASKLSSKVKR